MPPDNPNEEKPQWNIALRLPYSSSSDPLYIPSLQTRLPLFTQQFGNLKDSVMFGHLDIHGMASRIEIESIRGRNIEFKSTFEAINAKNIIAYDRLLLVTDSA